MNKRIKYISGLAVTCVVSSIFCVNPVLAQDLKINDEDIVATYKDSAVSEYIKSNVFSLINSVVFDDGNYLNMSEYIQANNNDLSHTLAEKTFFKLTPTESAILRLYKECAEKNLEFEPNNMNRSYYTDSKIYAVVVNKQTTIYVNLETNQIFIKTYVDPYIDMFVEFKDGVKVLSLYKQTYPKGNGVGGVDKSNNTGWLPLSSNPWFTFKFSTGWTNTSYGAIWDKETNSIYGQSSNGEHTTTIYAYNGVWPQGWTKISNEWHYFNYLSHITHEWEIDDKIYYFDTNGVWHSGWVNTNDESWSYYYPEGGKAIDTYVDGYYLSETGRWIRNPKGWLKNKNN